MTESSDLPLLPARPLAGHKGTFGRVLIIAGSRGMSGAACLAGLGALRGGAGLVYVACPSGIQSIVAGYEPSYLTIGVSDGIEDGQIDESAGRDLELQLEGKDAVAVGPGLGNSPNVRALVRRLYLNLPVPLIVDADGLNVLAEDFRSGAFENALISGPRILTPHPGEFSRLTGVTSGEIGRRREKLTREFAERNEVILALKGPGTIVTDGDRLVVNPTGNSGMATGGSGDVLTGLVASLAGQGLQPFDATRLGVYLHGLAGDIAATELSEPGLIASDLPQYLTQAWKTFRKNAAD